MQKVWNLSSLPVPRHCCVCQQFPFLSELPASSVTHCFMDPDSPIPACSHALEWGDFKVYLGIIDTYCFHPHHLRPELGIESRTSHVLGKHPSTQMCPSPMPIIFYLHYCFHPIKTECPVPGLCPMRKSCFTLDARHLAEL